MDTSLVTTDHAPRGHIGFGKGKVPAMRPALGERGQVPAMMPALGERGQMAAVLGEEQLGQLLEGERSPISWLVGTPPGAVPLPLGCVNSGHHLCSS